jgi:hypothetical protein
VIHPTYRRLDEPPKLAGFSFVQWLTLIAAGGCVFAVERLLEVPTQPAISVFTILVGGPAALIHFSESGRPSLLRLVRDFARWLGHPRRSDPVPGRVSPLRIRQRAAPHSRPHHLSRGAEESGR